MAKSKDKQEESERTLSLATHPRAPHAVRRIRARGSLIAFVMAGAVALTHGASPVRAALIALVAGTVSSLICWWAALKIWLTIIEVEAQQIVDQRRESIEKRLAEIETEREARRKARSQMFGG